MSSVVDAFNILLGLHKRNVTLRRDDSTLAVQVSPSNYARNLAGPSEMAIEGREFVISRTQLSGVFVPLKRGDRIIDADLGTMSIDEIIEMYDFGGAIIGYRLRTR